MCVNSKLKENVNAYNPLWSMRYEAQIKQNLLLRDMHLFLAIILVVKIILLLVTWWRPLGWVHKKTLMKFVLNSIVPITWSLVSILVCSREPLVLFPVISLLSLIKARCWLKMALAIMVLRWTAGLILFWWPFIDFVPRRKCFHEAVPENAGTFQEGRIKGDINHEKRGVGVTVTICSSPTIEYMYRPT